MGHALYLNDAFRLLLTVYIESGLCLVYGLFLNGLPACDRLASGAEDSMMNCGIAFLSSLVCVALAFWKPRFFGKSMLYT